MTCGIYSITNKDTGKMYIGQSIHIEQRFKEHIRYGNNSMYIDRSIKKHGKDVFDFNILLECDESELSHEEHKFINLFDTYKNGYNLTEGGEIAISKSPEIAKKISESQKGKIVSEETKQKLRQYRGEKSSFYGKHHSEETKRKLHNAHKGKTLSDEHRKKLSESHKGIQAGENHPMYGKHHSEKTKQKLSELLSGENHPFYRKKFSDDVCINMSKPRNTTGYFRVIKRKNSSCKQGFTWSYDYIEDDKRKSITSTDFSKLKQKVKEKGLAWKLIDENKAKENGILIGDDL